MNLVKIRIHINMGIVKVLGDLLVGHQGGTSSKLAAFGS